MQRDCPRSFKTVQQFPLNQQILDIHQVSCKMALYVFIFGPFNSVHDDATFRSDTKLNIHKKHKLHRATFYMRPINLLFTGPAESTLKFQNIREQSLSRYQNQSQGSRYRYNDCRFCAKIRGQVSQNDIFEPRNRKTESTISYISIAQFIYKA